MLESCILTIILGYYFLFFNFDSVQICGMKLFVTKNTRTSISYVTSGPMFELFAGIRSEMGKFTAGEVSRFNDLTNFTYGLLSVEAFHGNIGVVYIAEYTEPVHLRCS